MKDAVTARVSIGLAAAVSVALAIAAHEVTPLLPIPDPVADEPAGQCTCNATGVTDPDQHRALELACLRYSDDACRHRFEVFSTARYGDRRAVFVRRPTGDCGACGAFTVAVIFHGDEVELVDKLGEYGRMSNGPDAIRIRYVVGHPVIEVDESISVHGYSNTYREFFVVDKGRLASTLCLQIEGSDAGARERASEWTSNVWIANEGTLYFVPSYTKRGEVQPLLLAYAMPFEHGRWERPEEGRCIDPRLTPST